MALCKNSVPSAFIFDIEGTLFDNKSMLRQGVKELFTEINKTYPEKVVMFVSGMNEAEVKSIIKKINDELSEPYKLHPCLASCCGSRIIDQHENIRFEDIITKQDIDKINSILLELDPTTAIVYRTKDANYVKKISDLYKDNKKQLSVEEIDKLDSIYLSLYNLHNVPLLCKEVSGAKINEMLENKEVYMLELGGVNLNNDPVLNKKIADAIQKATKLTYSIGVSIQMAKQNKFTSIVNFLGKENAKNACYVGDGANDMHCLKHCNHSVCAFPSQQVVAKSGKFAINTTLEEIIPYCLGKPFDKKHLKELTKTTIKNSLKNKTR